uniref:Uncharacterized protein n=1 Tax=Falco tinnunculus TaxID=100819 RepID=A0A8C4UKY3_FALTI
KRLRPRPRSPQASPEQLRARTCSKMQRFIGLWLVVVEVIFLALVAVRALDSLGFISRASQLFVSSVIFKLGLFSSFLAWAFFEGSKFPAGLPKAAVTLLK